MAGEYIIIIPIKPLSDPSCPVDATGFYLICHQEVYTGFLTELSIYFLVLCSKLKQTHCVNSKMYTTNTSNALHIPKSNPYLNLSNQKKIFSNEISKDSIFCEDPVIFG